MEALKVAVSNDRFAHSLKQAVAEDLRGEGYEIVDLGTADETESLTHTQAAKKVALCLQTGQADLGILFCGTGMGVALAANKFKGINAAVCESVFSARHSRLINDCNVLCMGAYILGPYMAKEMAKTFVGTAFAEGFAAPRAETLSKQISIIRQFEQENFK